MPERTSPVTRGWRISIYVGGLRKLSYPDPRKSACCSTMPQRLATCEVDRRLRERLETARRRGAE
jgi:hypothetical protein